MAVMGTAGKGLIVYQQEGKAQEFKRIESPLKYQHRCVAIFRDKKNSPVGTFLLKINEKENQANCLILQALLLGVLKEESLYSTWPRKTPRTTSRSSATDLMELLEDCKIFLL
jgi:hypothetical protein